MVRLLILLAAMVTGALAQAPVIFTNIGPLSCGLRVYQPGQVQEYCYYNSPPLPLKIVCNALHIVTPSPSGSSLPVSAMHSCFAIDAVAGFTYGVSWSIWQPVASVAPGSTGAIQYQVTATKQPCAMNDAGLCANSGDPVTTMQQGALSDGIVAAAPCPLPGSQQAASLNGEFVSFVTYAVHGYYDCTDPSGECPALPDDSEDGWVMISCKGQG